MTKKELQDYANAMVVLLADFMPICPDKAGKMMDYAVKNGRKLVEKRRKEMLNELTDDLQKDLQGTMPNFSDVTMYIRSWKPKDK